jgi:hypothetical protein
MTDNVEVTQALREECEAEWDHLLNKTFSRHMAVEHLAQFVLSHRLAATASNAAMVGELETLIADAYYVLTYVQELAADAETREACREVRDKIDARVKASEVQP